jgi:hypothetical protein
MMVLPLLLLLVLPKLISTADPETQKVSVKSQMLFSSLFPIYPLVRILVKIPLHRPTLNTLIKDLCSHRPICSFLCHLEVTTVTTPLHQSKDGVELALIYTPSLLHYQELLTGGLHDGII